MRDRRAAVVGLGAAGAGGLAGAGVFFGLEAGGVALVFGDVGVAAGVREGVGGGVGVIGVEGGFLIAVDGGGRAAAGVVGWRATWGWGAAGGGVDGFCGPVPLRLFGVGVHVVPGRRMDVS